MLSGLAQTAKGAQAMHKAAQSLSMAPPEDRPKPEPQRGSFERLAGIVGRSGAN